MKGLRGYNLNFGSLKPGKHSFTFEVDDAFFSAFENALVSKGNADVLLEVDKQSEAFLVLHFQINGVLNLECTRCLNPLDFHFETGENLVLKLSASAGDSGDDELVFLDSEAYEIDLSPYIYDYITLALPLQITCEMEKKTCNPEMLKRLELLKPHHEENEIDPRWEQLNKIKITKKIKS